MRKILLFSLLLLSALSLFPSLIGIWHVGVWFPSIVFMALFLITLFQKQLKNIRNSSKKMIVIIPSIILSLCFLFAAVLSVVMLSNITGGSTQNTTVVVLGCKVNGDTPSLMLQKKTGQGV